MWRDHGAWLEPETWAEYKVACRIIEGLTMAKSKGPRWFKAMTERRYHERLRAVRAGTGCYAIRTPKLLGGWRVRWVGQSAGKLYQTCTRHFQNWDSAGWFQKQRGPCRVYDPDIAEVALWECSRAELGRLEAELIARLNPEDNIQEPVPF